MISLGIMLNASPAYAFGLDLDEMYRDIIKSENAGHLPSYSFNKVVKEKKVQKEEAKKEAETIKIPEKKELPASLMANTVPAKAKSLVQTKDDKKWKEVVIAVQKGNPSPFDIAEIEKQAEAKDVQAVEILAWIKANGVGCEQDLQKAWALYNLASQLGVKDAAQNANAVYRAMNRYEKDILSPF